MNRVSAIRWSAAAEALFCLDRPTAVSAGAGSGKTTALIELCLRLLSGEATGTAHEPSEIVAITFTEKAAAELEERLEQALASRATAADPAAARDWLSRWRGLGRMAVGTIHGFAGRLLREHAPEAGVDPEFTVLDEESAGRMREACAQAAVLAAADSGEPAALELCAAYGAGGSRQGLTTTVVEIVKKRATLGLTAPLQPCPADLHSVARVRRHLLDAAAGLVGFQPGPTTPTGRKARESLAGALERLSPADREGPMSAAVLSRLCALGGVVRSWRAGKADAAELRRLRTELAGAAEELQPLAAESFGEPQRRALCQLVADAEIRYAGAKRTAGALDFDDLLVKARDLLSGAPALRQELRRRTRALLVDEYQDVNRLQQEIFELLTSGDPGPDTPVLVAVGDLKQSIYRFRGAEVAVFSELLERFGPGGAGRVLYLSENHRSTPAAIELVNAVFERCMQPEGTARPYEIRFSEEDRLVPSRQGGPAPACEILEDTSSGNAAERRAREARAIARRIRALVSGAAGVTIADSPRRGQSSTAAGPPLEGHEPEERGPDESLRPRPPRYGEVALLFRRLTQIGVYQRALREAGIPFRLARGGGFYQAPEVRDLGELLVSLFEPDDGTAWAALLRSPLCAVSEGTLFLLSRLGFSSLRRRGPEEVVREVKEKWQEVSPLELDRLSRFLTEWTALRALRDRLPVDELLERAAERLDLEPALLAAPEGERKAVNLRKALAIARRHAQLGGGAATFGERLRRLAAMPPREPEADLPAEDAVAILSVHQAKGLEWPIVFVPDLAAQPPNDGRRALLDEQGRLCAAWFDIAREESVETTSFAAARAEEKRAAAAETRRLLYVALTRARDYLVLSGSASADRDESWAVFVSQAAESRPELVSRLALEQAGAELPEGEGAETGVDPLTGPALRLERNLPPSAVRMTVTDLAAYARCPRRHWFGQVLGLPERDPAMGVGSTQDDPARATARGTLAHAMLSETDLGAPPLERRARLLASVSRRGIDPETSGVRRIVADVERFLDSPAGRELARAARSGALLREIPFLLKVKGPDGTPNCYLSGAIDALIHGDGETTVVDFKYSLPRPQVAGHYRVQLLAYSLAASRAFPGRPVRARLQFLRGDCGAADLGITAEDLVRFQGEAPELALGASRGEGQRCDPARFGRNEADCRAEGCGYLQRCHLRRPTRE